jgi:hypothetical protein
MRPRSANCDFNQAALRSAGPDRGQRRSGTQTVLVILQDLSIKLANVIFSIVPPLAALAFVAGQSIVIFLLDVGVPAHGLEIVPYEWFGAFRRSVIPTRSRIHLADRFGAVSCPAAKSIRVMPGETAGSSLGVRLRYEAASEARVDIEPHRSLPQKNPPPPPNSPAKRGAKWSIIGVQIGFDRGCKRRRNAGFWEKGRGFESLSLHQRVRSERGWLRREKRWVK